MPKTKKEKKPTILITVILIIVVGIICFALGLKIGELILKNRIAEYEKMLDYYAPIPVELYSIEGKIILIKENTITLEAPSPTERKVPGEELAVVTYKITVDENTKITKTELDPAPKRTKITDLTLEDLKTGDEITVRSNENLVETTELTATLIEIIIFPEI